jgi:phosphohistidine phosphatase SixA
MAAATEIEKREGSTGVVEVRRELAPGGDGLGLVVEMLKAGRKRLMVVGHEPDLSTLVSSLIARVPEQGMLKSMVVGIKVDAAGEASPGHVTASLRFVLDPKTLDWQRG